MSIHLADVAAWLQAEFPAVPVQINRLQDAPDEVICNNVQGGPQILEGAFEESYVIVRVRGVRNDGSHPTSDADAEALSLAVHAFISAEQGSMELGTTYVMSIFPSSGPPSYSGQDVDLRPLYQGSYQFKVATI